MFRCDLPRIYELKDQVRNPDSALAYFHNFDESYSSFPQKMRQFQDWETVLSKLDTVAWAELKTKAAGYLNHKQADRGWEQLFNLFNEAKAFNFLKAKGYQNLIFVKETEDNQTPDIVGDEVVCEVKTINRSVATTSSKGIIFDVENKLSDAFFKKIHKTIDGAKKQFSQYLNISEKYIVIIVNFDDINHEYSNEYENQISEYIEANPVNGFNISFLYEKAFYRSMGPVGE